VIWKEVGLENEKGVYQAPSMISYPTIDATKPQAITTKAFIFFAAIMNCLSRQGYHCMLQLD